MMNEVIDRPDPLLERLLFAIDKGNADDIEHDGLKRSLLILKHAYETTGPHRTLAEQRRRKRVLQKMQANIAERRKLRKLLGVYGKQEIARAEWLRVSLKPTLKAMKDLTLSASGKSIEAQVLENLEEFKKLEQLEEDEDLCIGILIKEMQATYKKAHIRKVVVEPFLLILSAHNVLKSAHPLTDVMKALFDWLGVEKKHRPTDAGIRTIVHEVRRILSNQRWIFAKERKLTKIYNWRCRTAERRLEAVLLARARATRLLKIMRWRLKAAENKLGISPGVVQLP